MAMGVSTPLAQSAIVGRILLKGRSVKISKGWAGSVSLTMSRSNMSSPPPLTIPVSSTQSCAWERKEAGQSSHEKTASERKRRADKCSSFMTQKEGAPKCNGNGTTLRPLESVS